VPLDDRAIHRIHASRLDQVLARKVVVIGPYAQLAPAIVPVYGYRRDAMLTALRAAALSAPFLTRVSE